MDNKIEKEKEKKVIMMINTIKKQSKKVRTIIRMTLG